MLNNLTTKSQKTSKKEEDDERYSFDGDFSGFLKKKTQKDINKLIDSFNPILSMSYYRNTVPNLEQIVSNKSNNQPATKDVYKTAGTNTNTSTSTNTKTSSVKVRTGTQIKNNIRDSLKKKYGELDTRNLFDDIDDKDIEDNIETAENAIKTNIDRGVLSKSTLPKLPNLRDGLALSYAAANKGNNKEATRAREAAYTEITEPLVEGTGMKLLSTHLLKPENAVLRTDEKPSFERMLMTKTKSNENKRQNFDNPLLDTDISWQSKALSDSKKMDKVELEKQVSAENPYGVKFKEWTLNQKTKNTQENKFDYSDKNSSTLDKYELSDAAKDWLLPSDGILDFVGDIKNKDYMSATTDVTRSLSPSTETVKDVARSVWKTGSELYLRPRNLNISADMLEHSLQEKPKDVVFYEDSDVAKKIKTNSKFLSKVDEMTEAIQNKTLKLGEKDDLKFETNDDQDLYYSIHGCQIAIDNISYNKDGTKNVSVHITDNYDYTKIWTSMEGEKFSPFRISLGTLANDFGTITSKLDAINPYKVDIYFTIRR